MGITVRGLESLKAGQWLSEPGNRNEGALRAKGGPHGARFYFRYRDSSGRYDDLPLGSFDAQGRDGMSLVDAKAKAGRLTARYLSGDKDLRQSLNADADAKRAAIAYSKAAEAQQAADTAATFGALLTAYADSLDVQGKASARSVRSSIVKNAKVAHPTLWDKPAVKIEPDDVIEVIEKLTTTGKPREAAKLRSYIRAAYAAAINARTKPGALPALRKLKLQNNPARDVGTVSGSNRSRDRALSIAELRAYWKRISKLPEPAGAALRFHLLTGGQRIEQLARATTADIDKDAHSILLLDPKGRRAEPRRHWVPLLPEAEKCIDLMSTPRLGAFVWTVTNGERAVGDFMMRRAIGDLCSAMIEAGEISERFTPGDLRRTVETRMSALGVSLDIRAQLPAWPRPRT